MPGRSFFENAIPVGFWSATREAAGALPWPVPDPSWGGERRAGFLRALAAVEEIMAPSLKYTLMGFSPCRLCGCTNGSAEFLSPAFRWPSGYAHYVRDHAIMPPAAFVDWVLEQAVRPTLPVPAAPRKARASKRGGPRVGMP